MSNGPVYYQCFSASNTFSYLQMFEIDLCPYFWIYGYMWLCCVMNLCLCYNLCCMVLRLPFSCMLAVSCIFYHMSFINFSIVGEEEELITICVVVNEAIQM